MTSCGLQLPLFPAAVFLLSLKQTQVAYRPPVWEVSLLVAGCQIGLSRGHMTPKGRHFKMGNESHVCIRACASYLPQKAYCVISSNPLGGVKPVACSGKNTGQPAGWRSWSGCSRGRTHAAARPPSKARCCFLSSSWVTPKDKKSRVLCWIFRLNYRLKLCLAEFLSNSALKGWREDSCAEIIISLKQLL